MAPDAFTPDGDGKNDLFVPSYDCSISNYIIRIYNRWGQLVFESNNPNAGWDGTFEGRDQPIGTYVYYIEYVGVEGSTSEKRIEKGGLTLVR
jgi:gliding motility-associated-like protein